MEVRIRVTDLAIREGLSYKTAYDRALRGDYGRVVREGPRLIVIEERDDRGKPAAA